MVLWKDGQQQDCDTSLNVNNTKITPNGITLRCNYSWTDTKKNKKGKEEEEEEKEEEEEEEEEKEEEKKDQENRRRLFNKINDKKKTNHSNTT